jgi:hypothetical protein
MLEGAFIDHNSSIAVDGLRHLEGDVLIESKDQMKKLDNVLV